MAEEERAETEDKSAKDNRKSVGLEDEIKYGDGSKEIRKSESKGKSIDKGRKKSTARKTHDGNADNASVGSEGDERQRRKSRKKMREEARRLTNILESDMQFKDIGFETALTKEEKAEKRRAKKAARQAKLVALGLPIPKEKKVKKRKGASKTGTEEGETVKKTESEGGETVKKTESEGGETVKKTGEGKKKGKKGKKKTKQKEKVEEEEEKEPLTGLDLVRHRVSIVMEDFEQHRRQSLLLQGRGSSVGLGIKRLSLISNKRRKSSKKRSAIPEDKESSESTDSDNADDVQKKTEKKDKDVGDEEKVKKKKRRVISRTTILSTPSEHRSIAGSLRQRKKSKRRVSVTDDGEPRKSTIDFQFSEGSIISVDSGQLDEERKKKKRRKKSKPGIRVRKSSIKGAAEPEGNGRSIDSSGIPLELRRGSKSSRTSRSSKTSKYKRKSVVYDYEAELVVKKAVPPMVPQELPKDSEMSAEAEEADEKKKEKKGKKGKKKEAVEVRVEQLSVMEQIARMKAQADAVAAGPAVEETAEPEKKKAKKKKGGKKAKMTKEDRAAYNAEKAEQARLAAEAEAAAAAEAERIRMNNERLMASEKAERETIEQNMRNEQLGKSISHFQANRVKQRQHESVVKQEEEWIEYLSCDGLPDPSHCADMNTYLHLWNKDLPSVDMEEAERKTNEVLKLLNVMNLLIDSPYFDDVDKVENWKWVRGLVREHQVKNLDTATYRLLRNITQNMNRLNIPTADFRLKSDLFSLCVWLKVQLPIPIPNPRTPPPPRINLDFPEIGMKVYFPSILEAKQKAIRAIYLKYDHLSDTCSTFEKPATPEHYKETLQQSMANEWYQKMLYKYTNKAKPKKIEITLEDGTTAWVDPEPEPALLPGQMPPPVPYKRLKPNAEEYVLQMEEDVYTRCRDELVKAVPLSVLNMREYVVLGGVFSLDLYYQPPQPQSMVTYDLTFTTLERPLVLKRANFVQDYTAPDPVEKGTRRTPEEIEEDLKKQETALDTLILVTLDMPQHVIWLDVPIVVHWDRQHKVWTKKFLYDLKHVEEKNYITFRTSVFGPFALATNKYASLPYQAWELKPEVDGTITLQITTALLMLEFNIKGSLVSMTQLQNSPNNALQDIVGTYYPLSALKKILVEGGVDIFPEADAFCYVPRTCEKHYATEIHMYENMAQLAGVFNFSWSRWNLPAGRRSIVCQMREYKPEKQRQKTHTMLMVTPFRAVFIDCTEVSPVFNELPSTDDSKMHADLYHLMKGQNKVAIRSRVKSQPVDMVNTLADLLIQTRVNSFS